MSNVNRNADTMQDLKEQKMSFLQSELSQTRYTLEQHRQEGFDQLYFDIPILLPFKVYFLFLVVLFICAGFYEELTAKGTTLRHSVRK